MKLRPTIFLSGVSSELGSFRDAVEIEVQKKDCFPLNQSSFGVDYRTIEEILRRNIGEADAVIHIVGFRFGFEPKDRPEGKPRRSYTQMEYDIARELNKPVYVFLSADASVRDANPGEQPEDPGAVQLQLSHRQALEQLSNIRYSFQNKNELCLRAANIPLLATADFRVDISRIDRYAPAELIGREAELKLVDDAWLKVRRAETGRPHILTFVALGGEGKTSLVAKWLANLAYQNWPGCDSAFAWSFYSQGTRDQVAASSDLFLKEAITFFGNDSDKEFAASNAGAYEKGQRLARIVGQRRSLLILDGLEPLQYAPTSPIRGDLKDSGIAALLKGLAADSDGLCIVTTRYSLPNLKAYWQGTAPEIVLTRLSSEAGVHLLETLGVKGLTTEFRKLVDDVKGHALTLNLLGTYLRDAHAGDIRRVNLVNLEEADTEELSGHAFHVMAAYEQAFDIEGGKGQRARAILNLLGLFDRPVPPDCLAALLEQPAIPGLTEPLVALSEAQRNFAFKRLEDAKLLTVNRDASGSLLSLDAHPLLREYFAHKLRTKETESWREAHKRLYTHLCATTPDKRSPTLEDLQPLYQAIAHGCQAGLKQEACDEVYFKRIIRRQEFYSTKKLGAHASDLGAVAYFFDTRWGHVSPALRESDQAWLLNVAAMCLVALGRVTEALEPTRTGLEMRIKEENWREAALNASNLSHMELELGDIAGAVKDAEESVTFADRSGEVFQRVARRASHADALHRARKRLEAERHFREAEQMQKEDQFPSVFLYSIRGFQYCDFLLSDSEVSAWQKTLTQRSDFSGEPTPLLKTLSEVHRRADYALKIAESNNWLLDIALDRLTLGRTLLYEAVFADRAFQLNAEDLKLKSMLDDAVRGLFRAGYQQYFPSGLLTRAWLRFLLGSHINSHSAQEDLDEAWEIAGRGPMRLYMADIHLYRARLFFREKEYPWESPEADLIAARKLIEQCGYWRRKEELEDAERVILKKSV